MTPVEKDEFSHALGQTMKFFGKDLDKMQFSFWYQSMGDRPIQKIKHALLEYVKVGKFAPRPANVLELINMNTSHSRVSLPPPEDNSRKCPQEIADAWAWFINQTSDWNFGAKENPSEEDQEKYIHIVNHEAFRQQMPESIPDQYKLKEVWGV